MTEPMLSLREKSRPTLLEVSIFWIRNVLVGFIAALQFLTVAPPLLRRRCTPQEMGRSVGYFPIVGLLLGAGLLGLNALASLLWPYALVDALVLAAWVLATGVLHVDGFLDSCDGLLGGRSADERLRIMKDERVGAYAVVGGILLFLVKYFAMASIQDRWEALLLAPCLGRWSMVLAIVFFPYAHSEGLGRSMRDHAGWIQVLLATLIAGGASWLVGQERGLIALALGGGITWLIAAYALKRLPGLTGDLYGAIGEMVEMTTLLVLAARVPT